MLSRKSRVIILNWKYKVMKKKPLETWYMYVVHIPFLLFNIFKFQVSKDIANFRNSLHFLFFLNLQYHWHLMSMKEWKEIFRNKFLILSQKTMVYLYHWDIKDFHHYQWHCWKRNKPLKGMAPTSCLVARFLACLLAWLPACLPASLLACLLACLLLLNSLELPLELLP